jgi:hypothetical protein
MDTPRRQRLELNTPAEKSIYDAIQEVEKVGADVKLTEAITLLTKAKDLVSDFVDNHITFEKEDYDKFTAKELSQRQLDIIAKLDVEINNKRFGKKGNLIWDVFSDGELCAAYEFQARDIDGDMGSATTAKRYLSFKELIETIKNPNFDTRSWN